MATTLPDGAGASAHDLASWKFSEPQSWLIPELVVAEVLFTIDQLNEQPDSTGRALAAVDVFLGDRTEENRAAAEAAFLAVPASRRRYALGDMDSKDWPLRVLVAGPGGRTYLPGDPPVSQEDHDRALAYFEERARWKREYDTRVPADGPATPPPSPSGTCSTPPSPTPTGPCRSPGRRSAARSPRRTPLTRHASSRPRHPAMRAGSTEHLRTAVMTGLLRAKYDQHPELAEILPATDDATLIYDDMESAFWGDNAGRGRNWTGRLLELVRSELHLRRQRDPRTVTGRTVACGQAGQTGPA
ncbi:NADAR domain-containing protein [Streptomyces rubiginosohelvolus]|uniref:DUF7639 domain-containing protein n=1 Tax=Streptomyces rubiginosohelvolus TaxID=67362 RepID=UPI0037A47EAC